MSSRLRNRFFQLLSEKECRENRRITQREIAESIGVSLQTIGRWMHNDVTKFEAGIIEKLCDYFQCDVGDLLYIDRSDDAE
jgi:putative transcriptional regulator